MSEKNILLIKGNVISFNGFACIKKTGTATFIGNKIIIQPEVQELNDRKLCFYLDEDRSTTDKVFADCIRKTIMKTDDEFWLEFQYLPGINNKGLYHSTLYHL